MVASLIHRGPDDEGIAEFPEDGAALGMRRLSILDIAGGHQPMTDEAGRYCLVFNGEIYNYKELWKELAKAGHRFLSDHSDTEVIVHGFEEWGSSLFRRLNGMFAIAIWDRSEKRLTLARDRMGEKPLYLGRLSGGGYVFGSEMKALLLHPDLDRSIDFQAVEQYLAFDFVVGPRTVLRSAQKVPAGHIVSVEESAVQSEPFWLPSFVPVERSDAEIIEELDELIDRSVRLRMVADVPVGLFLSGGLDSTAVGYYMTHQRSNVRSFSIGFDDPAFDESEEAAFAASYLGTQHVLHMFTQNQVRNLVPRVTDLLDEPMGDQSIFPTYLLSLVARQDVTVALGGDGSDELFMGYKTYQALKLAWLLDGWHLGRVAGAIGRRLPQSVPAAIARAGRFGSLLDQTPEERLLSRLGSFGGDSRWVLAPDVRDSLGPSVFAEPQREFSRVLPGDHDAPDRTVAAYLRGYLQEDILVKVDRASMAASLEVRSPFLDPAIIDFACSLPSSVKMRGMTRKDPLRKLMRGRIPDRIIDRPKRGFGVPLRAWLADSLAPLVDDYLGADRIRAGRLFDAKAVATIIERHRAGDELAGNQVWLILQFELWRERWVDNLKSVQAS
jgi:asparagine synthase (glutamine-hydrolysing)